MLACPRRSEKDERRSSVVLHRIRLLTVRIPRGQRRAHGSARVRRLRRGQCGLFRVSFTPYSELFCIRRATAVPLEFRRGVLKDGRHPRPRSAAAGEEDGFHRLGQIGGPLRRRFRVEWQGAYFFKILRVFSVDGRRQRRRETGLSSV